MSDKPIAVAVQNVSKTYSVQGVPVPALANVSISVNEGELVTIVGPSGCGKSTLLRIILGIDKPDDGTVSIAERSSKGELMRDNIAAVLQAGELLPWRTLFQNACLGLEIRGRLRRESVPHVQGLIDEYGLSGFNEAMSEELSGGMKQRVAVIRALASRPELLLCDEPFSAVDFVTRIKLSTKFRANCLVRGITTIFVTHNIEEALFLGERVIVMSGRPGRVVATRFPPAASLGREDAVRCREDPEFARLFHQVWSDLKGDHAGDN